MKVVESINCFLLVGKGCRTLDNFVYCLMNSIVLWGFFNWKGVIQVDVKTLPMEPLLLYSIQGLFGYRKDRGSEGIQMCNVIAALKGKKKPSEVGREEG